MRSRADRRGGQPVYEITGTRRGVSEDVDARQRRYIVSMGVRTVCFVLAVVSSGWLQWAFLVGAVFLPYVAVVVANGGREPTRELPATLLHDQRRALGAAPSGPLD